MASRNLKDLHPDLFPLAMDFLGKCVEAGLDILVTCTYRSFEEQALEYAIGRTIMTYRKPVTMAKPGQSEHNFVINDQPASKAFDIVPMRKGKCVWEENEPEWAQVAAVWRKGISSSTHWLDWYGKKGAVFHEMAHFCLKEKF